MIDYKEIENCIKKAGQMVFNANLENASVEKKTGDANFCTEYDIKVQKFLIDELSKILPEASFFGEEDTSNNIKDMNKEYIFYIDPIDGTTNFMFNYYHSSVSVGLCQNGEMIAGFVSVRHLPCNAGHAGLVSGWRTKIPHAAEQLSPCVTTRVLASR